MFLIAVTKKLERAEGAEEMQDRIFIGAEPSALRETWQRNRHGKTKEIEVVEHLYT